VSERQIRLHEGRWCIFPCSFHGVECVSGWVTIHNSESPSRAFGPCIEGARDVHLPVAFPTRVTRG
jgi:hypothetical protein